MNPLVKVDVELIEGDVSSNDEDLLNEGIDSHSVLAISSSLEASMWRRWRPRSAARVESTE